MQLGPYTLERMQALARQGQVGRSHKVSCDGGETWDAGASFSEIFQGTDSHNGRPSATAPPQETASAPSSMPIQETLWHYSIGEGPQEGPLPESELCRLIELGRLGSRDMVWTSALGDAWTPAGSVPKFSGFFREKTSDGVKDRPNRRHQDNRRGGAGRQSKDGDSQKPFNPAGLSGFICSMVAIILLAVPCLVWVAVAESFFWIFNIVIPFTVLAVVGLVLSVIGLSRSPRGLATTGTVLGVIALMLGVMALVGWAMLPYRFRMQRQTQIDSFATDIKLAERTLGEHLADYREIKQEQPEPDSTFERRSEILRAVVGAQIQSLLLAYDGHVSACAKTSDFQQAFLDLGKFRKTLDEVGQAAQSVEGATLGDVLEGGKVDTHSIKVLLDTLKLYERGEISLKQAEAKMTGR